MKSPDKKREVLVMKLDGSFLGFTDNKSPMHKAKIEATLERLIRVNGITTPRKDFILNHILGGATPAKEFEKTRYSMRTGELLKPKMDYRLQNSDKTFYEISKTEYDFACYLLEHCLSSEQAVKEYLTAETELQLQKQKEQAALEQELQEVEKAAEKEKRDFEIWLKEQVNSYANRERLDLIHTVFLNLLNHRNPSIELLVLIENIDHPRCKAMLSEYLWYRNTASRRTFECVTGLKLPKTDGATQDFLASISSADYKEPVKFRKRNKQ